MHDMPIPILSVQVTAATAVNTKKPDNMLFRGHTIASKTRISTLLHFWQATFKQYYKFVFTNLKLQNIIRTCRNCLMSSHNEAHATCF